MSLIGCLLVLAGGFLGGVARFFVSVAIGRRLGEAFPWGTLAVNVSGALAAGLVAGLASEGLLLAPAFRDLAIIGFLGAYTTVSAFSMQTLDLALAGRPGRAAVNVAASAGLCIGAVIAGYALGGALL